MANGPRTGKGAAPLRVGTVVIWGALHLAAAAAAAAASSSRHLGEDFAAAFMQNGLQQRPSSDFKLLVTGSRPFTSVTISMKKPGLRMTVQVTAGQTILVKVPPQAEMVGSKAMDNAVVVRANNAISLVLVNEKASSVDSAVVYPLHAWGTDYQVLTPNVGTDRYGQFAVVAWDQPTAVEVHLKAAVTYQGRAYPRGAVLAIQLEPFQAAQLQSPSDLSGTRVTAERPVAVFTGHTCLARFTQCDHLVEQLRPVSNWGSTFIVPPLPFETQSDIVYVSTSQLTRVESQHGATKAVRELRPSRSTLYGLQASNSLYLSANAGVQVIFFADGGLKDGVSYDPFFMTIPDTSSYCGSYNVFALEGYDNYALVIAESSATAGITLNKAPLREVGWKPVPGTGYSWASLNLGGQFAVHLVEHQAASFGLLSVGIREQKAYGLEAVCDSDPCRLVKCRAKETCRVEKGKATCVHDYMGTCTGSQSLAYHTFDGVTVETRGGCTYTLAKSCGGDPALAPFAVEEKSQGGFKEWVANVYAHGYNISIQRGEGGQIQVNDKPTSLPATLGEGKVLISQNEGRTIVETDFGLQVTFAEDWTIMVAVPSSYFGATCGLCGNFNEDTEDEATLPDGAPAASLKDWAESWRDPSCQEECAGQEGPPGCAQQCPKNSHFDSCAPACPSTCSNPDAPTSCDRPCAAGCRCDAGFVLHRDTCVPADSCGCTHNSRSYKAREEFWEDGRCQRRCRCEEGGEVVCKKTAGCKAHERCAVVNGTARCQASKTYTCIGTGDPHYTTFDGLRYDFQGTCIYQFAALCVQQDPPLVPFTVTVENNNRGSKAVSFTKTITLEVYDSVISMSQEHPRKVKLNGAFVELPFSQPGRFELYHSGVHGFARTAFGLRLSFDWYSYARLILPEAYAGAVCGLCGNANGDPQDDFTTRRGQRAADETQLAESWKVGDVPGCSSGCAGACPGCKEEEKATYRGDGYCGVIAKPEGPFRACHGVLDPAPFLEDCAFDTCHYKGHRATLCKAVAAYVTECQARGVAVEQWRTPAFCGPSCPRHSHYELCGSSCSATCRPHVVPADCAAALCTEGCFCDRGYVLSGDECVAEQECGCEYRGRYYKKGEDFNPSCRERCRCQAGGVVECQEVFCGAHEECRVEEGVLGCYPAGYGRLVVSGDPHYVTFDGRAFDLPGSCAYVLARLCQPVTGLANFSVLLEQEVEGRGRAAMMKKVVVFAHGYAVGMERGRSWEVTVDGERYTLPLVTEDRKLRVVQEGANIALQTASGLRLLYNAATYLLIVIPKAYGGRVCGLGGNYNGDPGDDFRLPNGSLARSTEEFVTSWKIPLLEEEETCSDGCVGKACPACDATHAAPYAAGDSCGLIQDPEGPFGLCHPRVSPAEYFQHCLHDVCGAGGDRQALCHSLQAYAAACQAAGAEIKGWRTATFCPLPCPPHSHYELCTRTCDFTCASLTAPAPCVWRCFEGCQCDDGFLFNGQSCVSVEQCGCVDRGRYFKAGDTIISNNCSTKCNCHPSQGLVCEDIQCPPNELCATRDGAQRCVKAEGRCRVSPGASFITFDGAAGEHLVSGTYKMAALCNEQSPNWFKVVVEVSECRHDNVPAAAAIFVFFRQAFITVNHNMEVWVNGLFTRLPTAVSDSISLRGTDGGGVTIAHTSSEMEVLFNPNGEVTVTVGAALANRLCAPCGNFNGDPGDDLKLPDGRPVRDITEVIDAWKAKDFSGCD